MFEVEFYAREDGTKPAREFVDGLPTKLRAKAYQTMLLLEEKGNEVREPFSKYLESGIFELRVQQGNNSVRILYFFYVGSKVVFTNGFAKKTRKTPRAEIEKAFEYKRDYERRAAS